MVIADFPVRLALFAFVQPPPVASSPPVKALQDKALAADGIGDHRAVARLLDEALALARTNKDRVGEGRVLLQRGANYAQTGQLDRAGNDWRQSRDIARMAGDPICEGNALNNLGLIASMRGRHDAALEAFTQAAEVRRGMRDTSGEAESRLSVGNALMALGRAPEAYAVFQKSLALAQASKNLEIEAASLTNLGAFEGGLGQHEKALERFRKALPLHRKVGNPAFEANTLMAMGISLQQLKRGDAAMAALGDALPLFQRLRDAPQELRCLTLLWKVCLERDQRVKALDYLPQALVLANTLDDKPLEAETCNTLGIVYFHTGEIGKAAEHWRKAEALFRSLNDLDGASGAVTNQGNAFVEVGQFEKALELYERGLVGHRQTGNRSFEAITLNGMGNVHLHLGKSVRAMELYRQALTIDQEMGKRHSEGVVLVNLANVYLQNGQAQPALKLYRQAEAIFRETKDAAARAGVLTNTGLVYTTMGRPREAQAYFRRALPLYRATRDLSGESATLTGIGGSLRALGQPREAIGCYEQAQALARRSGSREMEASALVENARACLDLRLPRRALPLCRQAAAQYRAVQSRVGEAKALHALADTEQALGQHKEATEHLLRTVALLESLRADLGGYTEAKASFLVSQRDAYHACLRLLLAQGRTTEAFAMAQKTKARSLLDLMATGRVDLSGALTPDERAQETALRDQADALNAAMVRQGVENQIGAKRRYAALKARLRTVEVQLQALTDTLYARHPDLAQKRVTRTLDAKAVARALPADTALLEYVVLEGGEVQLFVVTRAGVAVRRVPARYAALARDAAQLRAACADPRKDYRRASRALYDALVRPAEDVVRGKRRVLVCPDGALWEVPFQALVGSDGLFVAKRFEIAYAYSATGVQAALTRGARSRRPEGALLVLANPDFGSVGRFGDLEGVPGQRPIDSPSRPIDSPSRPIDSPSRPIDSPSRPLDSPSRPIDAPSRAFDSVSRAGAIVSLPGTQREADALRRLFPAATVLTGKAAQESAARQTASGYRYLHFATHGVFNDASPMLSSLVLAQPSPGSKDDGFLTAREIFEMDLSAEMAVLSACNTARGVQRTGDGIIGLTWALFVAGCPTQVVSQWAVDDASTAQLMAGFYGNLATKKLGKGAALRQASLSLMNDPKRRHPYYWAPFVLVGDWR